jgi:hypothetical protein
MFLYSEPGCECRHRLDARLKKENGLSSPFLTDRNVPFLISARFFALDFPASSNVAAPRARRQQISG